MTQLTKLNPEQFDRFRDLIYRRSGISIPANKQTLLSNRIRRRLQEGQDFDAYYRLLMSPRGNDEIAHFIDAITTNETYFFRTEQHFDWLTSSFVTKLVGDGRRGERRNSIRIWSAGCATGAEPYSIVICLLENLYRLQGWQLNVLGTDISEQTLETARAGVFKPRAFEAVSEKRLRRFFEPADQDGCRRVRSEVRELTEFRNHNLLMPISEPPFDCVFIRNVLIYFDRASKRVVIRHLLEAMAPGGYLVVGPSEGIYDMLDPLERLTPYLYRRVDG